MDSGLNAGFAVFLTASWIFMLPCRTLRLVQTIISPIIPKIAFEISAISVKRFQMMGQRLRRFSIILKTFPSGNFVLESDHPDKLSDRFPCYEICNQL